MSSANNKFSDYGQSKEKNSTLIISTFISVIAFVLIILVIALPTIYTKILESDENAAISRLVQMINTMERGVSASPSEKKGVKKVEMHEGDTGDIAADKPQDSSKSNVISRPNSPHSLVYTIQAGSYEDLFSARELYDSIITELSRENLPYLRIEKIGSYYSVRIGKFEDRKHAKTFHDKIRSHLAESELMKAYMKEERIKKMHSS